MPWLKRNLMLVVGGLVALGLLGFAGYYLYTKIQLESDVQGQLESQTTELQQLMNLNPHPGNEKVNNIEAAKKQEKELQAFLTQARQSFVPLNYPTGIDSGQFRLLLDNTIDELKHDAERSGVKLQSGYSFTFAAEKSLMSFEQNTLDPMAACLMDIHQVCDILFDARILALDNIRRVAIAVQDSPGPNPVTSDYMTRKPTTNDLAVLIPYEFTFHCFITELNRVVQGLYSSPHCYLVKNVVVDPTPSQLLEKEGETGAAPLISPSSMNSAQMMMMMRYGSRFRPPEPTQQPQAPAQTKGGLSPMLDEKPFRVIVTLDVVRLKGAK